MTSTEYQGAEGDYDPYQSSHHGTLIAPLPACSPPLKVPGHVCERGGDVTTFRVAIQPLFASRVVMTWVGSIAATPFRISKCRCGPLARPEWPDSAIFWPIETHWPSL